MLCCSICTPNLRVSWRLVVYHEILYTPQEEIILSRSFLHKSCPALVTVLASRAILRSQQSNHSFSGPSIIHFIHRIYSKYLGLLRDRSEMSSSIHRISSELGPATSSDSTRVADGIAPGKQFTRAQVLAATHDAQYGHAPRNFGLLSIIGLA